jgi:hypothetical protein
MTECNNCGTFVTPQFARVFGDNEENVFGCPACTTFSDLIEGSASRRTRNDQDRPLKTRTPAGSGDSPNVPDG